MSQQPENPAKALYRYWRSVLMPLATDGGHGPRAATYFGTDMHYGIGIIYPHPLHRPSAHDALEYGSDRNPVLGFGRYWGSDIYPMFKVRANGEFQLLVAHGDQQRRALSRSTFLNWTYCFSEVQWFVTKDAFTYGSNYVSNWRNPIEYVGQRTIFQNDWLWRPAWLRLEYAQDQWKICFSRTSQLSVYRDQAASLGQRQIFQRTPSAESFAAQDALRLKRYALRERADLIADGTLIKQGRRIISQQEINENHERQALALADHMIVRAPVATNPVNRTLEGVRNGSNHLGTTDPL